MNELQPFQKKGQDGALQQDGQYPLQGQLWELLARQTALYTSTDSSSLPVEVVQELLNSICFTLEIDLMELQQNPDQFASLDLISAYPQAAKQLTSRVAYGKRLWQKVATSLPPVENQSMLDTVKGMKAFFYHYDARFFAHQIPCDIDYQLSWPIEPSVQGIHFINAYLESLWIEHQFLRYFPSHELTPILQAYCPDYKGLLINLYEPIATNVIGRALLKKDCSHLAISQDDCEALEQQMEHLSTGQMERTLAQAAKRVAAQLGIDHGKSIEYLCYLAQQLVPRIMAVRDLGGLNGIFLQGRG